MGQFGDCRSIVLNKIKEYNDWPSTKMDLELIFECFEVFMDYQYMSDFLTMILDDVKKINRDSATEYIERKINFYSDMLV